VRDGMPHGGDRLPGLQGRPAPPPRAQARRHPRAPPEVRRAAGRDRRRLAGGREARPSGGAGDDGGGPRSGESHAMTADAPKTLESRDLTLRVGAFEGPFDLLLHLCRTNEIDLARLPVRTITDQYLVHLEAIEFRDLEAAGAYLVMAATLIHLKSKLLVPPDPSETEALDEEGEALRLELEERLRAYARVKALGTWLGAREAEQALLWSRPAGALPPPGEGPLEDLSAHLLERAMARPIGAPLRKPPREIEPNPPSVLERMTEIRTLLRAPSS